MSQDNQIPESKFREIIRAELKHLDLEKDKDAAFRNIQKENEELRNKPAPEHKITHDDLKDLGFKNCPDGDCDKILYSPEEYNKLETCEGCGKHIGSPEWKKCPECGENITRD